MAGGGSTTSPVTPTQVPTTPAPATPNTKSEIVIEGVVGDMLALTITESKELKITVMKDGALDANAKIELTTANTDIISVDSATKTVKANKSGTATMEVKAPDYYKDGDSSTFWAKRVINITVEDPVIYLYDDITADRVGRMFINVGEVRELKAELAPATMGGTINVGIPTYKWEVSAADSRILSVNPSGIAIGRAEGEAMVKVTATYSGGKVAYGQMKITVRNIVNYIEISPKEITIEKGKTSVLQVTTYPVSADTAGLIWSSTDPRVAMVDGNGNISALKVGQCEVTLYSSETGAKDTAKVSVIKGEGSSSYYQGSQFSNSKPVIGNNTYSDEDWNRMEQEFFERIEDAGFGTRAACVEAALYLCSLDYAVPYRGTPMNRSANIGVYAKKGLNRTWGRNVRLGTPVSYNGREYDANYVAPNGMDCCGFVSWVVINGGIKPEGFQGYTSPGAYTQNGQVLSLNDSKGIVQPGDIACTYVDNKYSHIGFVIGVDDTKVYIAEESGGKLKTTAVLFGSKNYWRIITMENEYQAHNGTGNMPEVDW